MATRLPESSVRRDTKLNRVAACILAVREATQKELSTQLVFCDHSRSLRVADGMWRVNKPAGRAPQKLNWLAERGGLNSRAPSVSARSSMASILQTMNDPASCSNIQQKATAP